MESEPLSLFALGPLEARRGGEVLDLGPPLRRALLALLLHAAPHALPVPRLVGQLWPEEPPRDPVRNLQVHVSALRGALGHDAVETVGRAYRLDVSPDRVDLCLFEADAAAAAELLDAGRHTEASARAQRALDRWRGEAWSDVRHLPALEPAAIGLDERRVDVTVVSVAARLAAGRHRELVPELEECVRAWPLREELWAQLMLALHRSGRQADALAAYADARRVKVRETGLDPGADLAALQSRILADDPTLAVEDAELRSRRRLPALTTRLVGREAEVAALTGLLRDPGCRLLTLTGPGGIGKTRLALRAAYELAVDFPDGVWFVALADLRDPALVARTVAETLEVDDVEGDVARPLAEHVRERRLLLVLDNFEQVDDAAPWVSELLSGAAGVKVLVTSRTRLRLYGEHVREVDPLPPAEAMSLFTERAQEVAPWFDAGETAAIRPVCDALDCVPLALELVAARADAMSLEQMTEQLDARLELAAHGPRDRAERQRSLRAAIGWSVDLLPSATAATFCRLGVFVGGFDPGAAARVAGAGPDVLETLVRTSLVRRDPHGRHRMLEAVRELAHEQLAEDACAARTVAAAHADWHLELAERALEGMREADRAGWLSRLREEQGNTRAALVWLAEGAEAGAGDAAERLLRMTAALGLYWYRTSPGSEDVEWLARALELGADGPPLLLGRVHHALAICRGEQGRAEEALEHSRAAYAHLEGGDDAAWIARVLNSLAGVTRDLGRPDEAAAIMEEAIALRRRLADPALPLSLALANRAMIALDVDDPATARSCLEECLRVETDPVERALVRRLLADTALAEGGLGEAARHLREGLDVLRAAGHHYRLMEWLETGAALAVGQGRPALGATLLAAADRVLVEEGGVQVPADLALRERRTGEALAHLDPDLLEAARRRGAALDLEDVLDLARDELG